ncbi:pyridoxamine 5'-phosphate oxidase family protein [Streptomyces prunicolor]|uniref:pyridoxamine 5'-phosphate oxidase family protein n=1 Tax=Streptomyces prunicolor TaxID=67348 RepID=UPI0037D66C1A
METYHAGSRTMQDRVGVRELADHVGQIIGQGIKPVAAAFLELQPLLILGAADPATGKVWASPLTGTPGFVRATGPHQISITGTTRPTDPLTPTLADAQDLQVGTIALDPRTRRRMRVDGQLRRTERGLAIEAERVFANCPKYIQRRESYETIADRQPAQPRRSTELTSSQAEFIAAADTFFLATVQEHGADASHRGGNPGFVQATSPHELTWPDYTGNAMFLSLGNLLTDPRAGLLFLDWTTGTTLQLTGEARPEFDGEGERRVRFTLTEVVETPAAIPLSWSAPEYSPANPTPTR